MSRLHEIKAAQVAAAAESGQTNPYTQEQGSPAALDKPHGKLQQIKAAQLAEAAKTGINPYDTSAAPVLSGAGQARVGTLGHYQAAMEIDLIKIANQRDLIDKARVKQTVLPTYLGFVDDYMQSGDNYPNDVAVQVMIWLLDTLEIEKGLNLALHLVKQGQKMPTKFDRDMMTFLCDFFYDWANEELKADRGASPYLDVLIATAENDKWDVHPLCLGKLFAMLAKHKERAGDYTEALSLCEKAETINPEKAGVKGLKERLQKKLQ